MCLSLHQRIALLLVFSVEACGDKKLHKMKPCNFLFCLSKFKQNEHESVSLGIHVYFTIYLLRTIHADYVWERGHGLQATCAQSKIFQNTT